MSGCRRVIRIGWARLQDEVSSRYNRPVRFTLTYSGKLPSSSDVKMKHRIRRELHPQVKELWNTHPALTGNHVYITRSTTTPMPDGQAALLSAISGNDFATLVHPHLRPHCELDVLVLRPEAPGAIVSKFGDIDNQLKTLFDALRRPVDATEMPIAWTPSANEQPLFCLLGDDVTKTTRQNYYAFRRMIKNFACVEIHPQAKKLLVFLKGDPETLSLEPGFTRDVNKIGHFGTGNLEVTIGSRHDLDRAQPMMHASYQAS